MTSQSRSIEVPARRVRTRRKITLANGGRVQRDDLVMALVLGLPGFLVLLLLGIYPILSVLTLAFQQRSMLSANAPAVWVGLDNFRSVLSSDQFLNALRNSIVFTAGTVGFQFIVGLGIALLLHQKFFARNVFRGLILFSYVVPIVVTAIIWRFMTSESVGILYHAIRISGLPIPNTWFSSTKTAMAAVILIATWKFFPFMVINFLARLQTIDEQLYEAARVDGASPWQTFRHITLPSLMPVIVIVLLLRTIWTFNNWDVIALLTRGGPLRSTTTLPILVYNTMFAEFSGGRAAATAFIMTMILLVGMFFYLRAYNRAEERLA
ncbi:MAG: carbohydrate ABC transporter permease [Nitrososphaerales archaeon]